MTDVAMENQTVDKKAEQICDANFLPIGLSTCSGVVSASCCYVG